MSRYCTSAQQATGSWVSHDCMKIPLYGSGPNPSMGLLSITTNPDIPSVPFVHEPHVVLEPIPLDGQGRRSRDGQVRGRVLARAVEVNGCPRLDALEVGVSVALGPAPQGGRITSVSRRGARGVRGCGLLARHSPEGRSDKRLHGERDANATLSRYRHFTVEVIGKLGVGQVSSPFSRQGDGLLLDHGSLACQNRDRHIERLGGDVRYLTNDAVSVHPYRWRHYLGRISRGSGD